MEEIAIESLSSFLTNISPKFTVKTTFQIHQRVSQFNVQEINDFINITKEIEQYEKMTGIMVGMIHFTDQFYVCVLIFDKNIIIIDPNNLNKFQEFMNKNKSEFLFSNSQCESFINNLISEGIEKDVIPTNDYNHINFSKFDDGIVKLIVKKSQILSQKMNQKLRLITSNNDLQIPINSINNDFIEVKTHNSAHLYFNINNQLLYIVKKFDLNKDEFLHRFNHEVTFYDTINNKCPFISKCFGHFKDKNYGYIVIEYIVGETLLDYIKNKEKIISDVNIMQIMEIMIAIEYIHLNGFVLRDLKYDNIMVDSKDNAVLIDFDECKKKSSSNGNDDDEKMTVDIGSLYFTAPEQNDSTYYSTKVDIYALGMIIHFIFTKKQYDFPPIEILTLKSQKEINILDKAEKLPQGCEILLNFYKDCCNFQPNERPDIISLIEKFFIILKPQIDENSQYTTEDFFTIRESLFAEYIKSSKNIDNDFESYLIRYYGNSYNDGNDYIEKNIDKYIYYLKIDASRDNAEAQSQLGRYYMMGQYVEQNIDEAIKYFELAVQKNDRDAQFLLGFLYNFDEFGKKDLIKAEFYLKHASDNNNSTAQWLLAVLYLKANEPEKAVHYLTLSANNDNPVGMFHLGKMYYYGIYFKKDISKAVKYLSPQLTGNEKEAQNLLKKIYIKGKYERDFIEKEIKDLTILSLMNDSDAQSFLGFIYYRCPYVKTDIHKAIKFLSLAANQNNPVAQYLLGEIYYSGEYVEKDIDLAVQYFTLSADQNDFNAQYMLGDYYISEENDKKDVNKAIHYLTLSSNNNNDKAQLLLGLIYNEGKYIQQDINKAIHYLTLSSNQGNRDAQFVLGKIYYDGKYIPRNIGYAIFYLYHSAEQNNQEANLLLSLILSTEKSINRDIINAIKYLKNSSSFNNPIAKNNLGVIYMKGDGVDKNIMNAIVFFEEAIKYKNDPAACFNLARIYYFGIDDVEKNTSKAVQLIEQVIGEGFVAGEIFLYFIYTYGDQSFLDKNKSEIYLKRIAIHFPEFLKLKETLSKDFDDETNSLFVHKIKQFLREYDMVYTVELLDHSVFQSDFTNFMVKGKIDQ